MNLCCRFYTFWAVQKSMKIHNDGICIEFFLFIRPFFKFLVMHPIWARTVYVALQLFVPHTYCSWLFPWQLHRRSKGVHGKGPPSAAHVFLYENVTLDQHNYHISTYFLIMIITFTSLASTIDRFKHVTEKRILDCIIESLLPFLLSISYIHQRK